MAPQHEDESKKSKRPANTAFKQQRLKAWQPILTPKTVLPTFFVVGLIFIPVGIGLFVASDKVQQVIFDYTYCFKDATTDFSTPDSSLGISAWKYNTATRTCTIRFEIPSTFEAPVFIYYRLTNFFQNHRRYVKSFDQKQLSGNYIANQASVSNTCDPLRDATGVAIGSNATQTAITAGSGAQYYPCGLIANSLFNDFIGGDPYEDTMAMTCIANTSTMPDGYPACTSAGSVQYNFTQVGIAWPADGDKFKKTDWVSSNPTQIPTMLIPPSDWIKYFPRWSAGYTAENVPDLRKWERFQVWMRTAGLPNFRKLYGRNNKYPLTSGTYQLEIVDNFNVTRFSGTKSIVISTVSILGGKNPFLGVAYVVVGAICWILGIIFLARQMLKPRKLGDHTYLSWNQPPASQRGTADSTSPASGAAQDGMRSRTGY